MKKSLLYALVIVVILIGVFSYISKFQSESALQQESPKASQKESDEFQWCIENGGKDTTPDYITLNKCVLNNREYESKCTSNDKYFIATKDATDYAGSDVVVKYKSTKDEKFSCVYKVDSSDFEIKNDGAASYILSLEGDYLILDSGTGPDPRGLTLYDLVKRKKIFTDIYSSPVDIKNNVISYWTESTIKVTKDNCPEEKEWEKGGLGSAIETHVSLDLTNLVKKELGEHRCAARQ